MKTFEELKNLVKALKSGKSQELNIPIRESIIVIVEKIEELEKRICHSKTSSSGN